MIEFIHNATPDQATFSKAHRLLSKTIDDVRGVYWNVGETAGHIGLHPFEPLNDVRWTLETLGWSYNTEDRRRTARVLLIQSWNALRASFLREFSTLEPPHTITQRRASPNMNRDTIRFRRSLARRGCNQGFGAHRFIETLIEASGVLSRNPRGSAGVTRARKGQSAQA